MWAFSRKKRILPPPPPPEELNPYYMDLRNFEACVTCGGVFLRNQMKSIEVYRSGRRHRSAEYKEYFCRRDAPPYDGKRVGYSFHKYWKRSDGLQLPCDETGKVIVPPQPTEPKLISEIPILEPTKRRISQV